MAFIGRATLLGALAFPAVSSETCSTTDTCAYADELTLLQMQGVNQRVSRSIQPDETAPALANHGANCWTPCERTAGACDFCGSAGLCCRHGFDSDPEACGGGGAPNYHTCILPEAEEPEEPEPAPLQNEGANCWHPCDRTAGACDFCGTEGLCCREGFGSDPEECGGRGAPNYHTCILPAEPVLQNQGENCWHPCHRTAGACDYCGTEGLCCREGFGSDPEECGGRGASNYHTCILPAEEQSLQNEGENCWHPCDRTAGPCDYCGTEGVCCREGFASDPEECGGRGAPNFHTCIMPVETEEESTRMVINENWNCRGSRSSSSEMTISPTVSTADACATACSGEGYPIAAFWTNNRNMCRCYSDCDGGGATEPSWPNVVMQVGQE